VVAGDLYYRVYAEAPGAGYDLSPDLTSLTVEEVSSKADQLTLQLSDPCKVYSHALQEGMEVEVDLGRVDDHSVVFRGIVYKVEGDFPKEGVPSLKLLACDRSMLMGLRKRNRPWTDVSLTDIVNLIGKDYFLIQDINVTLRGEPEFSGNGIRQQNETDLAFLLRLARTCGCEMFVVAGDHADALHFEAQHHIMTKEPAVTLYHGRCGVPNRMLSFQATSNVSDVQLPRVLSGIAYETGERLEIETADVARVRETDGAFLDENLAAFFKREPGRAGQLQGLLGAAGTARQALQERLGSVAREVTPGFATRENLRVRAENQFSTSLYGMRGSGAAVGNHRLHAQSAVCIADVGGRFSKTWYLSQVRHVLDRQGYRTEFQCQR
jgi:phage protein D